MSLDVVVCKNTTGENFLHFVPNRVEGLVAGQKTQVIINTTQSLEESLVYVLDVYSVNEDVVKVLNTSYLRATNTYFVTLKGIFLGRTHLNISYHLKNSSSHWIEENRTVCEQYPVSVVREKRWVDTLFIITVAALVVVGNVAMGCKIDLNVVYEVLRRPVAPAIGFGCQFIIMPVVSMQIPKFTTKKYCIALKMLDIKCAGKHYKYFLCI